MAACSVFLKNFENVLQDHRIEYIYTYLYIRDIFEKCLQLISKCFCCITRWTIVARVWFSPLFIFIEKGSTSASHCFVCIYVYTYIYFSSSEYVFYVSLNNSILVHFEFLNHVVRLVLFVCFASGTCIKIQELMIVRQWV